MFSALVLPLLVRKGLFFVTNKNKLAKMNRFFPSKKLSSADAPEEQTGHPEHIYGYFEERRIKTMRRRLWRVSFIYSVLFLLLIVLWLTLSVKSVEANHDSPATEEVDASGSRIVRGTNTYEHRNETLNSRSKPGEKVTVYGSGFNNDYIYGGQGTDIFIPGPGYDRVYARSTHEGGG